MYKDMQAGMDPIRSLHINNVLKRWGEPRRTAKGNKCKHYLQTYHTFILPSKRKVVALHVQGYRN